jgi:hypothetical protein
MKQEYNKHTYEAYNTMIKVYIMLLQLSFKLYKIEKKTVLQKMKQSVEANILAEALNLMS